MCDTSVIARRLKDGSVQYGWGGNGGFFASIGSKLLSWYQTSDAIDYLFGLGQLRHLGKPFSEMPDSNESFKDTTFRAGGAYNVGSSERCMFDGYRFVDVGYLYDRDGRWYYIDPGPLRIKMPLELVAHNLDEQGHEFAYVEEVRAGLVRYLLGEYLVSHSDLQTLVAEHGITPEEMLGKVLSPRRDGATSPVDALWDGYQWFSQLFDEWALVVPDAKDALQLTYVVRRRQNQKDRIEIIDWT